MTNIYGQALTELNETIGEEWGQMVLTFPEIAGMVQGRRVAHIAFKGQPELLGTLVVAVFEQKGGPFDAVFIADDAHVREAILHPKRAMAAWKARGAPVAQPTDNIVSLCQFRAGAVRRAS
jgi:hypothetical protein